MSNSEHINQEILDRIAGLAKLEMTEDERALLQKDMEHILGYMEILEEAAEELPSCFMETSVKQEALRLGSHCGGEEEAASDSPQEEHLVSNLPFCTVTNQFREDVAAPSMNREELLAGAPRGKVGSREYEGLFAVPSAIARDTGKEKPYRMAENQPAAKGDDWLAKCEEAETGMRVAVKDNICVKGMPVTCASRMLADYQACYDATVIARLKKAGVHIVGKTNMDEFAMGSTTETSAFGPVENPCAPGCIPGGSSGGSAAAVAAGLVTAALGTDTGGSVRQPAAMCGVIGLKPTYGLLSRYGLIAYASSFDTIGTLTSHTDDAAKMLQIMAGPDQHDLSMPQDRKTEDYLNYKQISLVGKRIGLYSEDAKKQPLQPEIAKALQQTAKSLRDQGAVVEPIALPGMEQAVAAYYILACAEASSNLGRYTGVSYGYRTEEECGLQEMFARTRTEAFGMEVKRRILLGTYVLSSGYYDRYYLRAKKAAEHLKEQYAELFARYDAVLLPVAPETAWELGSRREDPLSVYLSDVFTVPANLTGLPAISVPAGKDERSHPIGVQFMAGWYQEKMLLRLADAIKGVQNE